MNIPTIPIGLVGLLLHPSSSRLLPSPTSRIDVFSVEVQMSCKWAAMSCIDAQRSCTCRSCVATNFGAASQGAANELHFPLFFQRSDIKLHKNRPISAQMSCKMDQTTSICYLYLYFPSHYNIIFTKSQAFWAKKILKRRELDRKMSRTRRRGTNWA